MSDAISLIGTRVMTRPVKSWSMVTWTSIAALAVIVRDTAGLDVYVPLWRSEVARLASAVSSVTVYTLPDAISKLTDMAGRIADPPGLLLTREQRSGRAAELIVHALTLALIDHGWKLHVQPGQFYVESDRGTKMNPRTIVEKLRNGARNSETWLQYCEENAIGDWPLVLQSTSAAS